MKNKLKYLSIFILGSIISGVGVYTAVAISSSEIVYDNSKSGLNSTKLQDAIDELHQKATTKIQEAKEACPNGLTCYRTVATSENFTNDSWDIVAATIKAGVMYPVGATKTVDMGEFGQHTVRVSNTSNSNCDLVSKTACGFVIEFADIITNHVFNSTETNVGGWRDSEMRTFINNEIYNALPNDLKSVISDTTVVSGHGSTAGEENFVTQDKLYLLSSKEVWNGGTGYDTAEADTRQLDYYANHNVDLTNNLSFASKNNFSALRTSARDNNAGILYVTVEGKNSGWHANYNWNISPAFRIA